MGNKVNERKHIILKQKHPYSTRVNAMIFLCLVIQNFKTRTAKKSENWSNKKSYQNMNVSLKVVDKRKTQHLLNLYDLEST